MEKNKNIALVAHDNRKKDLIEWFEYTTGPWSNISWFVPEQRGLLVEEGRSKKKLGEEKKSISRF